MRGLGAGTGDGALDGMGVGCRVGACDTAGFSGVPESHCSLPTRGELVWGVSCSSVTYIQPLLGFQVIILRPM